MLGDRPIDPPVRPGYSVPFMNALLQDAANRSIRYLDSLPTRPVAPSPAAVAGLRGFDEPMPAGPTDPAATLRLLDELGTPATMAMAGPRFFGFVIGGSLPVTLAANWLAGAWDQNTGLYSPTPGTAHLEQVALRWLLDVLGLPQECGGAFVTGATVANLTALAAARHAVLMQAGWNVEADGMFGAPPVTVIVGEEVHPTVKKSLGIIGLGRNRLVRVPVDGQGRMRADALPKISGPTIVIAQAGNVNTGAFDPIGEICAKAKPAGAWVHVDGAFGLWAAASPRLKPLCPGLELADSWATDAHKWLNVPYDCGLAFVRDAHALRAAMAITAEYLPTGTTERNPSDYTPELSRRAPRGRGVGGLAHAGPGGAGRDVRAELRPGAALCGETARGRRRDPQRRRAQPGAGGLRRRGEDEARDRGAPARRHLLGGRNGVAGPHSHAHQRVVLGHHGRRRRCERGRDAADREVGVSAFVIH